MSALRALRQPGPAAAERVVAAPCGARPVTLRLRGGRTLNQAVTGALAEAGFASGYVRLDGAAMRPMRYVTPAHAPDPSHVAWYSGTFAPEGVVTVEQAGVIAGTRDGEPFIHCHGVWLEPGGGRRAGHVLPHEAILAADAEAAGWGIEGAAFIARDDPETNFKLFAAEPAGAPGGGARALACTVRPNGDLSLAIEQVCRRHGIVHAEIHGVGSFVGVDFADGRHVPSYATEVLIRSGRLRGGRTETLDVVLVGIDGAVHEGVLAHGTNPVCITFELLIVAASG